MDIPDANAQNGFLTAAAQKLKDLGWPVHAAVVAAAEVRILELELQLGAETARADENLVRSEVGRQEINRHKKLLAAVYSAMLMAGWNDDVSLAEVRAELDVPAAPIPTIKPK